MATDERENIGEEAVETDMERYDPLFVLGNLVYQPGVILPYLDTEAVI